MPDPNSNPPSPGDPRPILANCHSMSDGSSKLVYQSEELLQGQREAWIEHRGAMYRLRVTRAGKLQLTK